MKNKVISASANKRRLWQTLTVTVLSADSKGKLPTPTPALFVTLEDNRSTDFPLSLRKK